MFGFDGDSFDFRLAGECAFASSPGKSVRKAALVNVVHPLVHLADRKTRSPSAEQEQSLLRQIHSLPPIQN